MTTPGTGADPLSLIKAYSDSQIALQRGRIKAELLDLQRKTATAIVALERGADLPEYAARAIADTARDLHIAAHRLEDAAALPKFLQKG